MGAIANVVCKYEDGNKIYFYAHWGEDLEDKLKAALIRGRDRWDKEPYLARIIFSETIKDDVLGTAGYGIYPYLYKSDGHYPDLEVDLKEQTVNGVAFEEFIC